MVDEIDEQEALTQKLRYDEEYRKAVIVLRERKFFEDQIEGFIRALINDLSEEKFDCDYITSGLQDFNVIRMQINHMIRMIDYSLNELKGQNND